MNTLKIAKTAAIACTVASMGAFGLNAAPAENESADGASNGWSYTPGEGVSFDEQPVMSAEFGLAFDSKYMTYGVIDGKDPIITPSAKATFFDWCYFSVESIFDATKTNGRRGGYGNRAGKYTTLDAIVGLAHEFDLNDDGLTLGVDFNYIYEYIHRYYDEDGNRAVDDTQYFNLELALGGLWVEPVLAIERDLIADDGTYVNFELGHTFTLIGDEEDQVLTFRPSAGQGFGDKKRTRGYELAEDHGGVMDTTLKGEFEWTLCDNLALGAYIAYYDYWFDRDLRHGAREHNSAWGSGCHDSYNIVWGLSLTATF